MYCINVLRCVKVNHKVVRVVEGHILTTGSVSFGTGMILEVGKLSTGKGGFRGGNKTDECPTDHKFKEYFEKVLNPEENETVGDDIQSIVNVPILDDQITAEEIQSQINNIKPGKACGPDGVSPGVLKMLPSQWLLKLAVLFNALFLSASYPSLWTLARFFTIFKKGNRQEPKNYRGITVINCLAKLYDMILCSRLER